MNAVTEQDPMFVAITEAVTLGRAGDTVLARERLGALWIEIGPHGDPFQHCALAHYLADLQAHPAEALAWDIRALDAADKVNEERVQRHHASLHIAGFYPSLHLNLADNFRRLGAFDSATHHIGEARERIGTLGADAYGDTIREAISGVAAAITARDTGGRASAPGAHTS